MWPKLRLSLLRISIVLCKKLQKSLKAQFHFANKRTKIKDINQSITNRKKVQPETMRVSKLKGILGKKSATFETLYKF